MEFKLFQVRNFSPSSEIMFHVIFISRGAIHMKAEFSFIRFHLQMFCQKLLTNIKSGNEPKAEKHKLELNEFPLEHNFIVQAF